MATDLQSVNRLHEEGEEATSMASVVSDDVLANIFFKLPVNYLLRCRSVCKSWYSLISSPIFVTAHRKYIAATGENRTIIRRRCGPGTRKLRYTLHSYDDSLKEIAEFELPFPNPNEFCRILGSVNGLICLMDLDVSLMLWNPTIRKSVIVATPSIEMDNPTSPHFGFGFDPLTEDYKIVRIVHGDNGIFVDIFKLSSRSWSSTYLCPETLPWLHPRQAYLNGFVYWLSNNGDVVGFDLHTEDFVMHKLPDHLEEKRMDDVAIAAWCGSLALFELENSRSICLWLMNAADESWTRQCVISFVLFPKRVKGIVGNGKILVEDLFGLLLWFDPATQTSDDLVIQDVGDVSLFHVKDYTESLVLVDLNENMALKLVGEQECQESSTSNGKRLRSCCC